ncbi:MAG TPA: hypothetical protein VGH32_05460, partial [Pirellulales bacterium]
MISFGRPVAVGSGLNNERDANGFTTTPASNNPFLGALGVLAVNSERRLLSLSRGEIRRTDCKQGEEKNHPLSAREVCNKISLSRMHRPRHQTSVIFDKD